MQKTSEAGGEAVINSVKEKMPNIIEITDLAAPELFPYTDTAELTLRNEHDMFVAESPKVIRTALEAGYEPVSLLIQKNT